MGPILAIAIKDLKLLVRDRTAAFFVFIFPLFVALFFGIIFGGASRSGGAGKMPIAVVNESKGPRAAALVRDLEHDAAVAVTTLPSRAEAETQVRRGRVIASVIVPESFDSGIMQLFSGGGLTLQLVVDPSRSAEAGMLEGKLNELAFRQLGSIMQDPKLMQQATVAGRAALLLSDLPADQRSALSSVYSGLDRFAAATEKQAPKTVAEPAPPNAPSASGTPPAADTAGEDNGFAWRPLRVQVSTVLDERKRPRSSFEISFGQGVVWGLMSCVTGFGASIAEERSRGTLLRLRTAPIRRRQVLLGKALAAFIACMLVQAMLLGLGVLPMFGIVVSSVPIMLLTTVVTSIGFCGLMMMLAGLTKTEGGAQGLGRAAVLVLAMIGGGTIPIFLMPPWLQTMSKISPFSWASIAIDGYTWRAFSMEEMALPLIVLASVGVIGFVIGTLSMRWQEN